MFYFRASIFWIAGLTGLPNIIRKGDQPLLDGIFWTPQVVGGTGFIISGFLFMLETQKEWWKPAWGVLGWWIGFWNLIGAFGFTVSLTLPFTYLEDYCILCTVALLCRFVARLDTRRTVASSSSRRWRRFGDLGAFLPGFFSPIPIHTSTSVALTLASIKGLF